MSALPAYDYAERAYEQRRARAAASDQRRARTGRTHGGALARSRGDRRRQNRRGRVHPVRRDRDRPRRHQRRDGDHLHRVPAARSGQISDARTEGNDLEVAQSMLSNPTRIKVEATALGMGAAADVEKIDLSGDVVVTDDVGNPLVVGQRCRCRPLTQGGTRCPSALATIAARTRAAAPVPSLTERRRRAESRPSLISTTRASLTVHLHRVRGHGDRVLRPLVLPAGHRLRTITPARLRPREPSASTYPRAAGRSTTATAWCSRRASTRRRCTAIRGGNRRRLCGG